MRLMLLVLLAASAAGCGNGTAVYAGDSDQSPPPVGNADQLEVRRVWAANDLNFYTSAPSPDGRSFTEVDWATGDLAVVDLEAGKMRRVTNKGPWAFSMDYAEYSVFSPDGQRIAYTWFSQKAQGYEVRTSKTDGTDTRVLVQRHPDVAYMAVEDWSRDGRTILVTTFRGDRTSQIGIVDANDGAYRALKTTDWRQPIVSAFSADGRFIAYDFPLDKDATTRDIFMLSVDGTREIPVVTGAGDDRLLGWLPDGSGILYGSSSRDNSSILALRITDGVPVGRPQHLRSDTPMTPFGFSRDAFFYGLMVERRRVHTATVDLAAGRLVDQPGPFGDDGPSKDAVWSPDGQSLAYISSDGRSPLMVIRSAAGELRRQFPLPLSDPRKTQWTPDGKALLVFGTDNAGRHGLHRVDLHNGVTSPVVIANPGQGVGQFYSLAPDGRTLYYRRRDDPARSSYIAAHDLKSGVSKKFLDVPPGRALSVSPDGKWLAYTAENMKTRQFWVMVAPTAGGEGREVFRATGSHRWSANRGSLPWTPDGRSVLFYLVTDDTVGGIWQVPVDGNKPRVIVPVAQISPSEGEEVNTAAELRISPDGRRLSYETGRNRGEVWMLKGFAPAARPAGGAR